MNYKHSILLLFIVFWISGYSQNCTAVIDIPERACINTTLFFTGSASNNLICTQGSEVHNLRITSLAGNLIHSAKSTVGVGRSFEFEYEFTQTGTFNVEYEFVEHPSCSTAKTCVDTKTIVIIKPEAKFSTNELRVCEGEEFTIQVEFKDADVAALEVGAIFSQQITDSDRDGVATLTNEFPGVDTFELKIIRAQNTELDCQNTTLNQTLKLYKLRQPDYEPVEMNCDSANLTYVMKFELKGGDPSEYSLVNPEDGVINGNILTTKRIPAGDTFNIDINYGEQCGVLTLNYSDICECNLAIDEFNFALQTSCAYDPLAVDLARVNGNDPNYRVLYVLHGELQNTLENDQIIQLNSTGIFDLQDPSLIDSNLYVTAVYGPFNVENFDYSVPNCKVKTIPKPVKWSGGDIKILGDKTICTNSRNIFYTVNSSANIDVNGIVWNMRSQDGTVLLDSITRPGILVSFDTPGNYRLRLNGDFQLNEMETCTIFDSIDITVAGNNDVKDDSRRIILWPGNIFTVNDDVSDNYCYQWGYVDKASDRPILIDGATDKFFYEDENLSILPNGVLEARAYFVMVYGNGQNCNPDNAFTGCYDVLFYNEDNIFRLDASGKDDFSISCYPNPSQGIFNVDLKGSYKGQYHLRVINAVGQVIRSKTINKEFLLSKNNINLSHAGSGLYYLEITNEFGERTIEKLIKS